MTKADGLDRSMAKKTRNHSRMLRRMARGKKTAKNRRRHAAQEERARALGFLSHMHRRKFERGETTIGPKRKPSAA